MCESESTIRDLRQSLDRAYNKSAQQTQDLEIKDKQLLEIRAVLRVLSFSMSMNSEARSLDESRWQDVAKWLASQIAITTVDQSTPLEHLAYVWLAKGLDATEKKHPITNEIH